MNPTFSKGGGRALWAFFVLMVVFLYLPILVLILFSFNNRAVVSFPWQGFTLRWYRDFIHNAALLASLKLSLLVATLSGAITVALGIPASIALVRRRFFAKGVVSGVLLAPLVVPLVVFGIALLVLFNTLGIPLSPLTIVIGHVVLALPFAILTLVPRLERIPIALEEASRDLGADSMSTFRLITFPLLVPAILSAFLICFTLSIDELVVASFTAGDQVTFPLYLFSQLRFPQRLPQVVAVAVVIMSISLVVVAASEIGRRISDRHLERDALLAREEPGA